MAAQEERVGEPADESEGRLPLDDVTHHGCIADPFELVNVPESLERAVNHFIDKPDGAVELGDASDKVLPDAEVAAFEGDEVAALEQSVHSTRSNDALGRKRGGFRMNTDIARQIEAQLDGCIDCGFDHNSRHEYYSSALKSNIP
jgi:hypothetical protein